MVLYINISNTTPTPTPHPNNVSWCQSVSLNVKMSSFNCLLDYFFIWVIWNLFRFSLLAWNFNMNKYGQSECWMLTPSTDNLVYISHQRQNRGHGDPGGLFFMYGSRVRLSLSTDICQVRFLTISEHLTSDAVNFVYRIMGIVPKIYCNKSHNYTLKSLVEIILNRTIYL